MQRYLNCAQRAITNQIRFGFKKVKNVGTEEFIATQSAAKTSNDDIINPVQYSGEKHDRSLRNEKPVPISPQLGPYNPFCDGKHKGTAFSPMKFTVEEAVESMNLCGCKFTTNAPFCDQKTCKCLTN